MEMKDPSGQNTELSSQNAQKPATASYANPSDVFRGSHHRRAHSEVNFRVSNDLDLVSDSFDAPSASFDEIGSEDDLFCAYMDIEKFGSKLDYGDSMGDNVDGHNGGLQEETPVAEKNTRPRHRHSNSMDGSSSLLGGESLFGNTIEAKKAMAPDKLAELWALDPKRAKRILANRQSAARSKERKARYISELERKVQTLQTEATTLSAQLTLFQRDTTGLSTENTELKLRLQAMEQQAELRDALNETLKKEVERLKLATGELMTPSDAYNLGMQSISYNTQSSFFLHQPQGQQVGPVESHMAQFCSFQPNRSVNLHHYQNLHAFSEMLQQDPLSRLQGLDIGSRSSHLVKPEGPSISASESSTTF